MSDLDEKENQDNSSEENANEIENLTKKKKQKNKENYDNQEDDYNSEEDDNYNGEEEPKQKRSLIGNKRNRQAKKNKKKGKNRLSLIEKEAEEDSNEEESYGEGELNEEEAKVAMDQALKQTSKRFYKLTDQNEDEFMEHIKQREEEQKEEKMEENIYSRPTSQDPKIWLVKCRIGEEKEVMENLYHKYFYFRDEKDKDKEKKKDKVKIYSVTSFENLKGKIFVEAFTERDVLFAIEDMSNVNKNSIQLVPVHERPKIFEYDQAPKSKIYKNQLVRIKGGNYDGDLAKVVYIEDPVNKIHVALVPRIIDNLNGKKGFNVAPFGNKKSFKPRQKLFDKKLMPTDDYDKIKTESLTYGETIKFKNLRFMDGLLIKTIRRAMLQTENVSPKEDELEKIGCIIDEDGVYTDKITKEKLTVANKANIKFKKGDFVKIVSEEDDEYNGQEGRVIETETGENIKIEIVFKDMKIPYSIPKNELVLVKHNFKNGDLVYAKFGSNKGRNGRIIQILENDIVTVYDDITQTKFEAKNSDLIFSEDMELDNEENEMFKIGDLVQIKNSNIVCYIIESTKFVIKVVTITNDIKKLSVREVNKINLSKRITCIDAKGNPIDITNTVKVINGQYKGIKGVIKKIYGKYVFLENYDFARTNGIFCEIKVNLELLGSELLLESSEKGRVNHRRIPNNIKDLQGKIIHIIKGSWKGYNGILLDGNDKSAKVELIAKQKTIEIPHDYVEEGDVNSAKDNDEGVSFNNNHGVMKTPAYYENKDKWE